MRVGCLIGTEGQERGPERKAGAVAFEQQVLLYQSLVQEDQLSAFRHPFSDSIEQFEESVTGGLSNQPTVASSLTERIQTQEIRQR